MANTGAGLRPAAANANCVQTISWISRKPRLGWGALAGFSLALMSFAGCAEKVAPPAAQATGGLPSLMLARDSVTVSGFSAGGNMAVQFHVAHSALVHGAGVFAAGPYSCAENALRHALGRCMKADSDIPVNDLVGTASQLALDEAIDPVAGLADDRVWIFRGGADAVVAQPVVAALQAFYSALVDPRNIAATELPGAGHVLPTNDAKNGPCGVTASPFVGNCGLDGARVMLEHLYGPFPAATAAHDAARPVPAGELRAFDQAPYAMAAHSAGIAGKGWLYLPAACNSGSNGAPCRLHVVFHGCKQGASYVQDAFVRQSGYLAAADAGRIVLLFPQIEPGFQPLNPNGCWDWWGYEGESYATKAGPQIFAVRLMIGDLLGEPVPRSAVAR